MFDIGYLKSISNRQYRIKEYPNREEWLKARRNTIGASEAAAVMGMSPWINERELYTRKTCGCKESAGNADTRRGQYSEAHIRELYGIEMGINVLDGTNIIFVSSAHPFMSCTLDGIIFTPAKKPVVMEIKSVRSHGQEWGEETIPNHYLIQVLHQLAVTGWDEATLVARFARSEGWRKPFERDYTILRSNYTDEIDEIVRREEHFWNSYVMKGIPPPVRVPSVI